MTQKTDITKEKQSFFLDLKKELPKREVVSKLFSLKIFSNTITLIGGPSLSGKTVISIHFANDCVINGKTVVFLDTDKLPSIHRPDPNLLRNFMTTNPEKYDKYFKYSTTYNEKTILDTIDKYKPTLLIIDSIYSPYVEQYKNAPKLRAQRIRRFLYELRDKLKENKTAVILTSQIGKESGRRTNGDLIYNILGGEGLKHLSDTKWVIDFVDKTEGDGRPLSRKKLGNRILLIDKQTEILMSIKEGGVIEKA